MIDLTKIQEQLQAAEGVETKAIYKHDLSIWGEYVAILSRMNSPKKGAEGKLDESKLIVLCKKLELTADDLEMHILALSEHARLAAVVKESEGSNEKLVECEKLREENFQEFCVAVKKYEKRREELEQQTSDAYCKKSTALEYADWIGCIENYWPELFGQAEAKGPAGWLPAVLANALNEQLKKKTKGVRS